MTDVEKMEKIVSALNMLSSLPGCSDPIVGKPVKYESGETGVCCYVERSASKNLKPYCLVRQEIGGTHRLWWLDQTKVVLGAAQ